MRKVILTRGLPASGKTTWAKEQDGFKRVSKDDLRAMLDNGNWTKENEKFILKARDALILAAVENGYDVIVDDTNLSSKHKNHIWKLVADKAVVSVKDFTDVSLEECIQRDQKRANYVGEKVIRNMYKKYFKSTPEKIEFNPDLPSAIICDLDGTLALFGDENPYERDFEKDTLNLIVADILAMYKLNDLIDTRIILSSGRKDKFREQTERWLKKNVINYDELFMRQSDDNRKDYDVKKEMYENNIKGKYNMWFVLDDRNQVVDLWRSLGLTCFQVAEGDF